MADRFVYPLDNMVQSVVCDHLLPMTEIPREREVKFAVVPGRNVATYLTRIQFTRRQEAINNHRTDFRKFAGIQGRQHRRSAEVVQICRRKTLQERNKVFKGYETQREPRVW